MPHEPDAENSDSEAGDLKIPEKLLMFLRYFCFLRLVKNLFYGFAGGRWIFLTIEFNQMIKKYIIFYKIA